MSRQFESYYYNNKLEWSYEGRDYHINLRAKAKEYHDPGRQYLRNGDPGDPPEDDFELISVDAVFMLRFINTSPLIFYNHKHICYRWNFCRYTIIL